MPYRRMIGVSVIAVASLSAGAGLGSLDMPVSANAAQAQNRPLVAWELIRSEEATVDPNSSAELIARCPRGKVPLGGGFSKAPSTPDSPGGVEIASSFPAFFSFEGQTITGWIVHVVNRSTANAFVTVWATCAQQTGVPVQPMN